MAGVLSLKTCVHVQPLDSAFYQSNGALSGGCFAARTSNGMHGVGWLLPFAYGRCMGPATQSLTFRAGDAAATAAYSAFNGTTIHWSRLQTMLRAACRAAPPMPRAVLLNAAVIAGTAHNLHDTGIDVYTSLVTGRRPAAGAATHEVAYGTKSATARMAARGGEECRRECKLRKR